MSALFSRPSVSVICEFTDAAAHIANDARSIELPLDRDTAGALTAASREAVIGALRSFASRPGSREQAFCLLPARGVSLRRLSIPAASKAEIERLLPLQIDAQFPLSSEELAWGYLRLNAGAATLQEIVVAAAKKESIQAYRELFDAAGFDPLFSIAALSRPQLSSHPPAKFGVIEIGSQKSELVTLDESGPATLRVIPIGAETSTTADPLIETIRNNGAVQKLYVSGKSAAIWSQRISPGIPAEPIFGQAGQSTAIAGLRETLRRSHEPLLIHDIREAVTVQRAPVPWRWAVAAAALLLLYLGLRFADPILRRAQLSQRISELSDARARLPKVDREVGFLQFIKTNQPAYIDVIASLAGAAQPGTKFDSVSLSRRGDLSLRGTAQSAQAPGAMRTKMLESGFFSTVVLDEQTPGQNNQVTFRMTAHLRPDGPAPKASNPSTNALAAATNVTVKATNSVNSSTNKP